CRPRGGRGRHRLAAPADHDREPLEPHCPQDHPRQRAGRRDELRVRLPDRLAPDRDRRRRGARSRRILLRPALRHLDRGLAVDQRCLHRHVPRCRVRRGRLLPRRRGGPGFRRPRHLRPHARPAPRPPAVPLAVATPLIIASAGMAVSFRAGLFNIGGTGQLIVGAMAAGYIGFSWDLPVGIHLLVALLAGTLAGAVWGGIAGFLKARFGANEVISTIMLNWIATYLLFFALKTTVFTGANQSQPTSPSIADSATLPVLLGPQFRLHAGLVIAAGSAVLLWWLMSRSTLGFQFRAVGSNPRAARVAGISPARASFSVLVVAGALVGLAGAVHVLGTEKRLTEGVAGSIGFDAITVALLQVIQALVVLFIAAPPLVRTLIGLRHIDQPGAEARLSRAQRRKAAAATVDSAAGGVSATEPTASSADAAATGLADERSAGDP